MSPDSGRHVALIFIAVFGFAAVWFSGFIWQSYYQERHKLDAYPWNRILAIPSLLAIVILLSAVLYYW